MDVDTLLVDLDNRLRIVEDREPVVRALLSEPDRRLRLAAQARALPGLEQVREDPRRAMREANLPLLGQLVGVKDILHVEGFVTRAGTRLPPELFAGSEAACVQRLRRAGALVLGKTVTTEFAYFEPGPTTNPHDPTRTPGGSSSGSAAAVAAGYCPLALGTQTVGSVIRPAAFCGVVGFKPTYGRIPTGGLILCSPSVDTIGLFATDVVMAHRAAAVLVDDWASSGDLGRRPVLGVPTGSYLEQASPEGLDAFDHQMAQLREVGLEVREIGGVFDNIEAVNARHGDLQAGEMANEHAAWMAAYRQDYRLRTWEFLLRGQQVSLARQQQGQEGRDELRDHLTKMMDDHEIDAWVCPSATGPAPIGIDATGDPIMNLPWTHAGMPVVSLPAGRVRHLPVGLQVTARADADEALLDWARCLERALWPLDG